MRSWQQAHVCMQLRCMMLKALPVVRIVYQSRSDGNTSTGSSDAVIKMMSLLRAHAYRCFCTSPLLSNQLDQTQDGTTARDMGRHRSLTWPGTGAC